MKSILSFIFFATTLFSHEILETASFREVLPHLTPRTLLLLDIDDTLLIPVQTLGTDAWFLHQLKQNAHGPDPLDRALAQWEAIRHLTEIEIVERGTEEIIAELQERKIPILGLTTQGLALATRTVKQLESLHIDLSKSAPTQEDCYFINEHGVLLRKGILFTAGTKKGPALAKLLELLQYRPEKIVFINDKKSHLLDVALTMDELEIPFIGLRYSYRDEAIANFSPELAEIQYAHSTFGHILSDEEASDLLHAIDRLKSENFQALLEDPSR